MSAKGPQEQTSAAISYPIPLCTPATVKPVYRDEAEAEAPKAPCDGEIDEPVASPGYLCVFRGGFNGSKEIADKHAKFFEITDLIGNEHGTKTGEIKGSPAGAMVTFRTTEFDEEEGKAIAEIKESASLTAIGSWATTAGPMG